VTQPVRPGLVPPAEGQRHKRFRLSIVGADEDMPRLVRAYGRACQGEFGLVLRPPEQRGVLVLVTKKTGSFTWESEPDDKDDSPQKPAIEATAASAVALVKDAQKSPPKVGPVTLRGRWTGYLYCEGGQPRVELKRRLATYGTLWVFSNGTDGWAWTFERDSKWFGGSGETYGKGLPTVLDALHIAVLGAMTLVKDACSFRDTHRRAAHDDDYATKHPIKKREPKRNPTERLKEPAPKKPRTRKAKPRPEQPAATTKSAKAATTGRRTAAAKPASTTAAPPKRTRTRKAPAPKPNAAATGPVDAEKDKALIDAFSRAFAEVLGEGAA